MSGYLRELLVKALDDFDAGNSNITEEQSEEITNTLSAILYQKQKLSKYQAYTYLGISRATFDNYVKSGKLPKGRKQQGFKEKFWYKNELIIKD